MLSLLPAQREPAQVFGAECFCVQTLDEPRDPAELERRLRDGDPGALDLDDMSRLGRMLVRLSAALEAAGAGRPGPAAMRENLIVLVPRLRRYAGCLTFDPIEADDLVRTSLLKAWPRREELPPGPTLAAWLFAVLRRSFLRDRRWSGGERSAQAARAATAGEGSASDARAVRDALDWLTRAQREALLLVTVEGLPSEAAAAIMDCPVEVVREHLAQANDRLARDLGPA